MEIKKKSNYPSKIFFFSPPFEEKHFSAVLELGIFNPHIVQVGSDITGV